jgi:hypothetical protein
VVVVFVTCSTCLSEETTGDELVAESVEAGVGILDETVLVEGSGCIDTLEVGFVKVGVGEGLAETADIGAGLAPG